jgi:hypothetical protein
MENLLHPMENAMTQKDMAAIYMGWLQGRATPYTSMASLLLQSWAAT